ncbi:hypothetical protein ACEUAO_21595, partial [Aeromonas caviae]
CMVFLLMGGAYLRSRIKQAGKWDQETIVSFFLCQYCSGEYLRAITHQRSNGVGNKPTGGKPVASQLQKGAGNGKPVSQGTGQGKPAGQGKPVHKGKTPTRAGSAKPAAQGGKPAAKGNGSKRPAR